jgi:phosphomannomutase
MRGKMGPGPGRMNRALVRQVTAGLGHFLLSSLGPEAAKNGVAVAFDGRKNSRAFAEDAAVVLATMGIVVHCFEDTVATPRLAHALTHLNAAAGIMVTASHNPPADNGYKVYWSNGAQIISPVDKGISAAIDAIQTPADVAMGDAAALRRAGLIRSVPDSVWDAYLSAVLNLRVHTGSNVRAVYTALHGVGYADLARLLDAAGHAPLLAVKEQRDPDGDFPTVSFPNPEEPGAMDLALALAQAQNADIVLANDPDADRLSVAIPDGQGQWRQLTGN